MTMKTLLPTTPVLCLAALSVFAQPAHSQESRTKRIRMEAGYSETHDGSDKGFGGAVHFVSESGGSNPLRLEAGLIAGPPYAGLDAGLEVRLPKRTPVGLLLRAGGGLLVEDGFVGAYARGGGGIEMEMSARLALRGTWQAGTHGGQGGPHLMHFGVDYRW